jgi:preprotein translocase subunit SecD
MTGSWWAKVSVIAATVLLSIYVLLPNFLAEDNFDQLAAQAAEARSGAAAESAEDDAEIGWLQGLLPDTEFNLGIDLAGGIDLTLVVEVDEAVLSQVGREARPLSEALQREGIAVDEVRRMRGQPALLLRLSEGESLSDLRAFMQLRYDHYGYEGTQTRDGLEYHVFLYTDEAAEYTHKRAVEQALETLRNRVNETGVKEPTIMQKGGNRITVQLPGMDDIQQARDAIGTTAVLEFMMVDEDIGPESIEKVLLEAERQLSATDYSDDRTLSDWLVRTGRIPDGDRLLWKYQDDVQGNRMRVNALVVKEEVVLTGDDINDADVNMNQYNEPYVSLSFKPRGARIFSDVTGQNVGKRFAIVLDDEMRSAPVIREKIAGGMASIEMGGGGYQEQLNDASVLSLVLRTGALPAPVTIAEVRVVGATLGHDAIVSGVEATFIGGLLVLLFMLFYYKTIGFVADIALMLNVVFIMALLAAFGATLTLPGIAGIALTIGMAVDANIIIFERIREELRLGKTARAAVDAGFDKAISAVLDANVTTFIAGVVLFSYGSGPIKGFAVTLMIGIATTLFSAIFVSRTMLDLLTRKAATRLAF